ncbi:hypothetical protein CLOHYLEM_07618 [[Clostridium] hylemonae DSM 15053]|uniref:Uncharacterized protein n=1 Tax=[Clostridium] hylemonae DSM 15053 TaxID=553973 RepID=C0C681_9FIRM|nr:hypothetical protein CLOHYLEM_07618 [[Clostridium] hylemonae DSM 15053]
MPLTEDEKETGGFQAYEVRCKIDAAEQDCGVSGQDRSGDPCPGAG